MKARPQARRRKATASDSQPRAEGNEVWVHPDITRLLKGPDYKLASREAERYWMDRRRQVP